MAVPSEVEAAARDDANLIGKYVRTAKLGAGGMGVVWRAWDTHLDRWVALKLLTGDDEQELARFRREATTAARLSHPNIAAVYEARDNYIAMQLVDGATLDRLPREDTRHLVETVRQAALAIAYAHECGVIHRDLKPANIMVDTQGRVFVLDFGLARSTAGASPLSQTGLIQGTPQYMSPEQARGSTRLDGRTDVWSLGATLYELVEGHPAFAAPDVLALLRVIEEVEPAPLRRADRDLATIIGKCLEKDPARRYADVRSLADDLGHWHAGELVSARAPSLGYRIRKRIVKSRAILITAAIAVLVGAGFAIPALLRERREREALRALVPLWVQVHSAMEWRRQGFRNPGEIRDEFLRLESLLAAKIARHPRRPQGYYVRAIARLAYTAVHTAEADLVEAVRLEPAFAPGWSALAQVYVSRHHMTSHEARTDEAARLLEAARDAFGRASRGTINLDAWGLEGPRTAVNDLVSRALETWYVHGRREEARLMLQDAFTRERSEAIAVWLGRWAENHD